MSEFHIVGSSVAPPPTVPTSFETDDGTAVPAANVLIIDAADTQENNDNGIETKGGVAAGDPPGTGVSNEVTVYLTNRITGTVQTIGATTGVVLTFTPPITAGVYALQLSVIGYNSTDGSGANYYIDATGLADGGGSVTAIGAATVSVDGTPEFTANLVTINTLVGTITVAATGIAGKTVTWTGLLTYRFGGV